MLVQVLSFGSSWWARYGKDVNDPFRFTRRTALYNSTGVRCGRKVRRHWVVSGLIRFNGEEGLRAGFPASFVGKTFCCSDLTQFRGGNRLLVRRQADPGVRPEFVLVVISSGVHGRVDFRSDCWKSIFSVMIAATALREVQEIMLLMRPGDWIQTDRGFWQLIVQEDGQSSALELLSA